MRLLTLRFVAAPFLLSLAACTAQGSSTVVQGPEGSSGAPIFPGADTSDGGSAQDPGVTDYAALFGPPASTDATPNSLNGLWAGRSGYSNIDTRIVFAGSSIVLALRCDADPIGIKVAARVTSGSIKTLESKDWVAQGHPAGTSGGTKTSSSCSLGVLPVEIPRCTSTVDADANYESTMLANGCFFLSGTSLTFYNSEPLVGAAKLTKLSD